MKLAEAMALILSENAQGLSVAELTAVLSIRFPELLDARGDEGGSVSASSPQRLAQAISSALEKSAKRFIQDTTNFPMTIRLRARPRSWTNSELEVAVREYLQMRELEMRGSPYVKMDVYRRVASALGRSEESIELRMRNISTVLSLTGKRWIRGLVPARNVGSDVGHQIEAIIAAEERRPPAVEIIGLGSRRRARAPRSRPLGNSSPETRQHEVVRYVRDAAVRDWVLATAAGVCELCQSAAPFEALTGPYLEVHHVRRLADQGADCISNAVALCPNCHRRLHYGLDAPRQIDELYRRIERLTRH